ncbi:MAG: PhzF family phenazine biosynthesis isomerase, partial [Rhodospirillales bacterium]
MSRTFVTADVFADRPFGGNPLAVFPDGAGLSSELMQAIAREFNLSETVFVLPPADPAHTRALRIFTPAHELPFAGHPTIGTAHVLAA